MTSEIIAVGSELLTPQRVDTNSLFLTRKLNECGIEVVRKSIIGDDREKLTNAIFSARKSSDLVIVTGGLGPTLDDITRDAVAAAVGRELVYHDQITQAIRERFLRRGRKMAEVNLRQAYIIEGADILENLKGTAPGQWFKDKLGVLILLPGPPRELEPMVETECVSRLKKIDSPYEYYTAVMRSAGVPESELDERIGPIYSTEPNVATTILAAPGDIQIHLRARGDTVEQAQVLAETLAKKIEDELGEAIYNRGNEEIEEVIGAHLQRLGLTLAVAESCTGGLLAQRLTSIQGSSKYFLGGWVSYTENFKTTSLDVSKSTITEHGAVSAEVAKEMASQVQNKSGAAFAVSITGFAGPASDEDIALVGTVFIGLADPSGCVDVSHHCFPGDRSFVRMLAVQTALRLLLSATRNQ